MFVVVRRGLLGAYAQNMHKDFRVESKRRAIAQQDRARVS